MDTITDTATTTTTRGCRHAECKRKGKTFKTAAGRTWHLVNIHGVGVKAEPTPEPTPVSEAPKLEGKRLEDVHASHVALVAGRTCAFRPLACWAT